MNLFLPFDQMPTDWPTSVIPLDPRGLFFAGDLTHGGARHIVAFIGWPNDHWSQPWALTAPVPEPLTIAYDPDLSWGAAPAAAAGAPRPTLGAADEHGNPVPGVTVSCAPPLRAPLPPPTPKD